MRRKMRVRRGMRKRMIQCSNPLCEHSSERSDDMDPVRVIVHSLFVSRLISRHPNTLERLTSKTLAPMASVSSKIISTSNAEKLAYEALANSIRRIPNVSNVRDAEIDAFVKSALVYARILAFSEPANSSSQNDSGTWWPRSL